MEIQRNQNSKKILLKNNKAETLTLPYFKTYYGEVCYAKFSEKKKRMKTTELMKQKRI